MDGGLEEQLDEVEKKGQIWHLEELPLKVISFLFIPRHGYLTEGGVAFPDGMDPLTFPLFLQKVIYQLLQQQMDLVPFY